MAIVVLSTGGTIASTGVDEGGAEPQLSAENLISSVPELETVDEVRTNNFSNIPSPHFTIEQMAALSGELSELDKDPEVDGVVVTQGTDILEETAYFADLTYDGETPVIFTGAMRNPSLPSPDGPMNLLASARVTSNANSQGRGVMVCFNDRVHAASDVTKTHSMNNDTFRSPEKGPLGAVDEDRITWFRRPEELTPTVNVVSETLTNDVHAVTVTADMPVAQIQAAQDAEALCFAATGAGHIPPSVIEPLSDLRDQGITLVATTRCPEGRLARETYGFPGSEATLRELDCYFSPLNLQKTRIATILGVTTNSLNEIFPQP